LAHQHSDNKKLCLALDTMGGDLGPAAVVKGVAIARANGLKTDIMLFGDEAILSDLIAQEPILAENPDANKIMHAADTVSMTDKPAQVLRRGRQTSMWLAIQAVKDGRANALISGGNTGALMALSRHQMKMIKGVDRPAITAFWPTPRGRSVVLDVGANVEASELQLVQFAVMGSAFFQAMTGQVNPSVGLLNVGAEELKGHELIRQTAKTIRTVLPDMHFAGFVEGNDISKGTVDVVVTDGFSGNIALKSAEGAVRLVGLWMKEAVKSNWLSKFGSFLMMKQLKSLRRRIDPAGVNGGVFLGINGVVVKSHGGSEPDGIASAVRVADDLVRQPFLDDVSARMEYAMEQMGDASAEDTNLRASKPKSAEQSSIQSQKIKNKKNDENPNEKSVFHQSKQVSA